MHKGPTLTTDALIEDDKGRVLLIKRGVEPFKGHWCLPGGKVDLGERVEAALEREMMEELKVRIGIRQLFGVYSDPDRDPRGHFVSVVYHATIIGGEPTTTEEVSEIRWLAKDEDVVLGFDHGKMLQDLWMKKSNGRVWPKPVDSTDGKDRLKEHPVDAQVAQSAGTRNSKLREVEDEAGRGKRVRTAAASNAKASPTKAKGTKRTAPAGRSGAKR